MPWSTCTTKSPGARLVASAMKLSARRMARRGRTRRSPRISCSLTMAASAVSKPDSMPSTANAIAGFGRLKACGQEPTLVRLCNLWSASTSLMRGVFGQMLKRQRRTRQIVEQSFQRIVEQREPVLHAGIAATLAHRFVQQVVRRASAELGDIAGAEAPDGFGDELEFRHRHQV